MSTTYQSLREAAEEGRPVLDLSINAFRKRRGDIEIFGTWLGKAREPCLVLIPSIRRAGIDYMPCVVRLGNAWIYDEAIGDDTAAHTEAFEIAQALNLTAHEWATRFAIISAIRDHLGDLLTLHVKPSEFLRPVADVITTDRDSGKQTHAEIMDDV